MRRGRTSPQPHSAVSGEEWTEVLAHSFLGKIPEFQNSIELFWGVRNSQAWHPCEECCLSTSAGCPQDVLWLQKNGPLFGWILHDKHSVIISRHFLSAHRSSPMSIVLCVGTGRPSSEVPSSYGFMEALDHYYYFFYFNVWNIYINIFPYIFPYKYKYKIFRNFM